MVLFTCEGQRATPLSWNRTRSVEHRRGSGPPSRRSWTPEATHTGVNAFMPHPPNPSRLPGDHGIARSDLNRPPPPWSCRVTWEAWEGHSGTKQRSRAEARRPGARAPRSTCASPPEASASRRRGRWGPFTAPESLIKHPVASESHGGGQGIVPMASEPRTRLPALWGVRTSSVS